MYYNLSDEQKIFLHVSYSMLEEGYDVDQILEFWSLDDEDEVKEIFESVTLSEEIDTSNPDFLLICERGIPGLGGFIKGLFGKGLRVRPPKVKVPTQTASGRPITSSSTRPSGGATVTRGGGSTQGGGLRGRVGDTLRNNKGKIIGGAALTGGILGGAGLLTNILPPEPGDGNDAPREPQVTDDKQCRGPGGCPDGRGQDPSLGQSTTGDGNDKKDTPPAADPKETKPKSSYGWWMLHRQQPDLYKRSPGYRVSRDAYRNIRANPRPSIYDNFDLIADYLINEGHASTIEEAEYVMQQLDNDFIQSIIEEYPKKPIGYSNPSIDGNPIPNPPGHPKEGKPMSFNKAETEGYREAMQKHRKRYPNSYKK